MAEIIFTHSYLLLILPLLGFVVIGLWMARKYPKMAGQGAIFLAALNALYSLVLATAYYQHVLSRPELYPNRTLICFDLAWLNFSPGLTANMGIYLDPISMMMIVVITVISLLVNIYSIGYMKDDPAFGRFFALMSLFSFSMLGLVVASNILQMFVFWELVGMSSYALIGFWYEKPTAVAASKKAFIVTRFADAFFLIGILLVSFLAKSFDFQTLNLPETAATLNQVILLGPMPVNLLTLATLLIFAGGWGKSAMFPLHIWLPDAMEGPTPVSSIIHSATMVVAGVFLTARMFPLFSHQSIDFYKKVFNAEETLRLQAPDGKIGHAEVRIGDSMIMLADEYPEVGFRGPRSIGGTPVSIALYVDDVGLPEVRSRQLLLLPEKCRGTGNLEAAGLDVAGALDLSHRLRGVHPAGYRQGGA